MPFTPSPINLKVTVPMKGHARGGVTASLLITYKYKDERGLLSQQTPFAILT